MSLGTGSGFIGVGLRTAVLFPMIKVTRAHRKEIQPAQEDVGMSINAAIIRVGKVSEVQNASAYLTQCVCAGRYGDDQRCQQGFPHSVVTRVVVRAAALEESGGVRERRSDRIVIVTESGCPAVFTTHPLSQR